MGEDPAEAIVAKIAELKGRWPTHSVPPAMWEELEELEEELAKTRSRGGAVSADGAAGAASPETSDGPGSPRS